VHPFYRERTQVGECTQSMRFRAK